MKTLLVEDDATTRQLVEALLRARGYDVTAVADAESAWAACQQEVYPLLVLDWLLPGMDGLQLCRQIRTLPHGDRSVIVVLTARDQAEDLRLVLDAGADDYLTKPVEAGRLDVRLTIAERQLDNLAQRKQAEARASDILAQLQLHRDDLLSILNQLRIGSALTDEAGRVTFVSHVCQQLLGADAERAVGRHWEQLWPLDAPDRLRVATMLRQPAAHRSKLSVHMAPRGGAAHWVDIEVQDDPRDPRRKIFFLYDMSEVHDLRRLLDEKAQFEDLVGRSEPMLRVYQQIREVAAVDTTVLIEGETGTGKELVARAIHFSSRRKDQPFIALNSAGLTDSLLGSQLFGHKRGAFTGAVEEHKGLFEAAAGGTVFLDEIGDIPPNVQASLLRVLQEREIVRLGESTPRKIDVRVLAATHHNLAEDVTTGTFRADLLYRIRVARIALPPLRGRREDVPLLVGALLRQCVATTGKPVHEVSNEVMRSLLAYTWPGNVRELRSAIEFAVIRCKGAVIEASDLPPELTAVRKAPARVETRGADTGNESDRVRAALATAQGNRAHAARILGISRATLYRRMTDLHIPTK
jgi:sigma-54 dependent transcriptional regulator, acetoin dehydrogenase operon transcriptional activator AcoR